jgi:hypothetical protein
MINVALKHNTFALATDTFPPDTSTEAWGHHIVNPTL